MYKDAYMVYVHRFEGIKGVYVAERPKKVTIPLTTDPKQFAKDARKYGINANKNWITFGKGVVTVEGHSADWYAYFDSYGDAIAYMKTV